MKRSDLRIGEEYAVHARNPVTREWSSTPCRAKLLSFARRLGTGTCMVELLEDAGWSVFVSERSAAGSVLELSARNIWRSWAEQAQLNETQRAMQQARDANTDAVRDALGRLGLHDQRRMTATADPAEYQVVVSASELAKLANRADHLVELERLVNRWHNATGEPYLDDAAFAIAAAHWAGAHDFSMLDAALGDSVPPGHQADAK